MKAFKYIHEKYVKYSITQVQSNMDIDTDETEQSVEVMDVTDTSEDEDRSTTSYHINNIYLTSKTS